MRKLFSTKQHYELYFISYHNRGYNKFQGFEAEKGKNFLKIPSICFQRFLETIVPSHPYPCPANDARRVERYFDYLFLRFPEISEYSRLKKTI